MSALDRKGEEHRMVTSHLRPLVATVENAALSNESPTSPDKVDAKPAETKDWFPPGPTAEGDVKKVIALFRMLFGNDLEGILSGGLKAPRQKRSD